MIHDVKMSCSLTSHWKYVDDITISQIVPKETTSSLQSELDNNHQWASTNHMKLNAKKCKVVSFSFLRNSPSGQHLYIDGQLLDCVATFKVLGISTNDQLTWNDNIEQLLKKAAQRLNILRILRCSTIPASNLISVYCALVRSVLELRLSRLAYLPTWISLCKTGTYTKTRFRILYPYIDFNRALELSNTERLEDRRNNLC